MATARIFKSGNSQAVRLPKGFRFDVDEVEIIQRGNTLILRKPKQTFADLFARLKPLPADLEWEEPADPPPAPLRAWSLPEDDVKPDKKRITQSPVKPLRKRAARKTA